jgi:hypothetical protein
MRKFLKYLLFFIIFPLVLIPIGTYLFYVQKKSTIDSKIQSISKYESILMGDSQAQRLNPKLITLETYNFASAGEHYFFTYNKLKALLKFKNHKIKQVILTCSVHNFSPIFSRLYNTQYSEGKNSLNRFIYFIDISSNNFIKPKDYISSNLFRSLYKDPDWGGFGASTHSNADSAIITKSLNTHYKINENEEYYASEQVTYLKKIDSICNTNNIPLYIVSTPYHSSYKNKINANYYAYFNYAISTIKNGTYIDFLNYNISPSLLSDANHLNTKGSNIITKMIDDSIILKSLNNPK